MAIGFRSSTSVASGSRTDTTGSAPAGLTAGDVLVAFHEAGNSSTPTVTGPSGWTLQGTAVYTATDPWGVRLTVWTAPHTVSDYTWVHSSATSQLWVGAYSGVDTTTPIDVTGSSAVENEGSPFTLDSVAPSITTVTDGAMLVIGRGSWDGNAITPPASWTERFDAPVLWVGDLIDATAGATGDVTVDSGNSSTAAPSGIVMIALRPYTAPSNIPQNLTATAVSSSQINLSWDSVAGATGYDIERDGSVIVTDHSTTSYNNTGLSASTNYVYKVRAVLS